MKKEPPPLVPGDEAPAFSLRDQHGLPCSLASLRGKHVVVFFVHDPGNTGAIKQSHGFKEQYRALKALQGEVVGISDRPKEENALLVNKVGLPFRVLSDETRDTVKAYGAWKPTSGKQGRWSGVNPATVLVDPEGRVARCWFRVHSMDAHAAQVVGALKELAG